MPKLLSRFLVLLLAVPLAGCGSTLSYSDTVTVEPGTVISKIVEAPKKDQQVRVEFTSDQPVAVIVILSDDAGDLAAAGMLPSTKPEKALGSKSNATSGSFDISVPANKEFQILIGVAPDGKAAKVELKANSV